MEFKDKTVLIAGRSAGVGYDCARRFAQQGAHVIIAEQDGDAARSTVEELGSAGRATAIECEFSRKLDIQNLMAEVSSVTDRVDAFVFLPSWPREHADAAALNETELKGVFNDTVLAAHRLIGALSEMADEYESQQGASNEADFNIVAALTSRVRALDPGFAAEAVSVGALRQLLRAWSLVLAPKRRRVNMVVRGTLNDSATRAAASTDATRSLMRARIPLGRFGDTSEAAEAIVFLASGSARYITGAELVVDGGRAVLENAMHRNGG